LLSARLFLFSSIRSFLIWSADLSFRFVIFAWFRKGFAPSDNVICVFLVTITEVLPSSKGLNSKLVSSKESDSAN